MKFKVMVVQKVHEAGLNILSEVADVVIASDPTPERLINEVKDVDGILVRSTPITKEILEASPKLKVVGRHGVGVDNVDVKAATELGIAVVYAPGSNTIAVAEHTAMLMLAIAKNVFEADKALRIEHNFNSRFSIKSLELCEKTLGLVGIGKIGRAVANICIHGLGMHVIAYDPYVTEAMLDPDLPIKLVQSLDDLLKEADVVSLHAPATPENYRMMGEREFGLMKDGAIFISAARGSLVDEGALYRALKSGKLAGAGLDVFDPEPPLPTNPLFSLSNVIVTPHMAAHTGEALMRMATMSAEGIVQVLKGERPTHLANPEVWEKRRE
ncbi:MAG TPA: hydroxyacid dehydrogenase [Thermosynergistes sp.]|nr:hydroxyacid dehydrogenase [Thermosynergistes sp.]